MVDKYKENILIHHLKKGLYLLLFSEVSYTLNTLEDRTGQKVDWQWEGSYSAKTVTLSAESWSASHIAGAGKTYRKFNKRAADSL